MSGPNFTPSAEVAEMNRIQYELEYTEGISQRMRVPETLKVASDKQTGPLLLDQPLPIHTALMQVPERIVVAGEWTRKNSALYTLVIEQGILTNKKVTLHYIIPCRWWWGPSIFSPSRPGLDSVGTTCRSHKYESTSTRSYAVRTAAGLSRNGTNLVTRQTQPHCKGLLLIPPIRMSENCKTWTPQLFVRIVCWNGAGTPPVHFILS